MASRFDRKLRKLNADFLLWRQKNIRDRQKDYLERIGEIQRNRLDYEAGSRAFDHVSRAQRLADRLAGIGDAIRRLDLSADPFKARYEYLTGIARTAEDKAEAVGRIRKLEKEEEEASSTETTPKPVNLADPPKSVDEADLLRADIGRKHAALDELDHEEQISLSWIKELSETLENDSKPVQKGYDDWYSVLNRPAYNEKLQTRSTPSQVAVQSDAHASVAPDDASVTPDPWLLRLIKNILGIYAAPILLPLEAAFAYPAFRVLSPEASGGTAAAAGAMIFTLSLALLGSVTANAALRAFRHNVVRNNSDADLTIRTSTNKAMVVAACFSFLVVLILVTGGADMRSKIPRIETSNQNLHDLRDQQNQILDRKAVNPDVNYDQDSAKIDKAIAAEMETRRSLLIFHPGFETSDKLVAIGVYFAMFLSSAMSYIMSRDPYMEYSILAEYLVAIRDLRQKIAIDHDIYEVTIKNRRKVLKSDILDLRTRLWLFDHSDRLALDPYANDGKNNVTDPSGEMGPEKENPPVAEAATKKTRDADAKQSSSNAEPATSDQSSAGGETSKNLRNHSVAARVWVHDRLARYTGWYVSTRGRRHLDQYAESIKKALERNW